MQVSTPVIVGGVVLAVVAVVIFLIVRRVSTTNADAAEHTRRRAALHKDNATIRVCVRVTGGNTHSAVTAILECMAAAASPARLRFAVVTDGATDSFVELYMRGCGTAAAAAASTQLRVYNAFEAESGGWLEAWELWHGRLADDESAVLVINLHRHKLEPNWDRAVARLAMHELPAKGLYTASAPDAFPCLALGNVDHRSFPRVVPRPFAVRAPSQFLSSTDRSQEAPDKHGLPFSPAVVLDKDLIVMTGRGDLGRIVARAVSGSTCSLAEADVALSGALFKLGCTFHTRPARWFGPQRAELWWSADRDAKLWQPGAGTDDSAARAQDLSKRYTRYAGLRHAPAGIEDAAVYDISVDGRMGLTPGARGSKECARKYGTASNYEFVRRRIEVALRERGRARGDDDDSRSANRDGTFVAEEEGEEEEGSDDDNE